MITFQFVPSEVAAAAAAAAAAQGYPPRITTYYVW